MLPVHLSSIRRTLYRTGALGNGHSRTQPWYLSLLRKEQLCCWCIVEKLIWSGQCASVPVCWVASKFTDSREWHWETAKEWHRCVMFTDHAACTSLLNSKNPLSKLVRWVMVIQKFHAKDGWLQKFLKRHSFSLCQKTTMGQRLTQDLITKVVGFIISTRKASSFQELSPVLHQQHGWNASLVGYARRPHNQDKVNGSSVLLYWSRKGQIHCCSFCNAWWKPYVVSKRVRAVTLNLDPP